MIDPDVRVRPDLQAASRTARWVRDRFGDAVGQAPPRLETCIYTSTADDRFLIQRYGRLVAVSACSGHGLQYAPETGRRIAGLL
ncbi:MAG: hypothetical protein J2P32_06950 [Actinobacteria bacterium]|nr:hypothetical protein [Actinomycetota bacterium]